MPRYVDHWAEEYLAGTLDPEALIPPVDGSEIAFNPFLNLYPAELARVADLLIPAINDQRGRNIKSVDIENFNLVVGMMVANALIAHEIDTRVHYSRAKKTYVGSSIYFPRGLSSKILRSAMGALSQPPRYFHTLNEHPGEGGPQARFLAGKTLLDHLSAMNITIGSVYEDTASKPVIILEREKKEKVEYNLSAPEVVEINNTLRTFNSRLRQADIRLELPHGMIHERDQKLALHPPQLKRIFKKTFDQYGRFHGGWWQDIESQNRPHITIERQPTVELDFKGCSVRLIYHMDCILYDADPYEVPQIKSACLEEGLDWKLIRQTVKDMTQIVFNSHGRYHLHDRFQLPEAINNIQGFGFIEAYHVLIRTHFHKKEFNHYMNLDSIICNNIIKSSINDGIVLLPIHDSFIVKIEHEDWLRDTMIREYRKLTNGFYPVIH